MKVLFIYYANVGRSQVAEACFKTLSQHDSHSAGIAVNERIAQMNFPVKNSNTLRFSAQLSTSNESSGSISVKKKGNSLSLK